MNIQKLRYTFHSGKNSKPWYYTKAYLRLYTPSWLLAWRKNALLKEVKKRNDYDYIQSRVDYYNKLTAQNLNLNQSRWEQEAIAIKRQPITRQKVYYFDTMEYARCFNDNNRWCLLPGDITKVNDIPTIVKSRPIAGDNKNSVLMKMDKVRHFIFVHDKLNFTEKKDMAIFRGKIAQKEIRERFVKEFYGKPRFDIGTIDLIKPEWKRPKISLYDHLKYKYVMASEGNDVASNLKWVMSSNSIAIMPRPVYETWFMEGMLKPDYHYIEVKPDFSDLEEKMDYYTAHPEAAQAIIDHAHEYVEQFKDSKREDIISLLVLDKYFSLLK